MSNYHQHNVYTHTPDDHQIIHQENQHIVRPNDIYRSYDTEQIVHQEQNPGYLSQHISPSSGFYGAPQAPYAQGAGAATAGTIIAAAGLTWEVAKEIFKSGAVTYQLLKMSGAKYPRNNKKTYGDPPHAFKAGTTVEADAWRQSWQGDLVGVYFDIRWHYNDYAVSAVEMIKRRLEGAWTKWSLQHEASFIELPVTFVGKHGKACAGVRITNTYEWRHWLWGSKIAREEIILYGDGDYTRSFKWIQE